MSRRLVARSDSQDGVTSAAELYAKGHRNVIWEAETDTYSQFAAMAAMTMCQMKKCSTKDEKTAVGKDLKLKFSPATSSSCGRGA